MREREEAKARKEAEARARAEAKAQRDAEARARRKGCRGAKAEPDETGQEEEQNIELYDRLRAYGRSGSEPPSK